MRLMDISDSVLSDKAKKQRYTLTHWPSKASAWLPCEVCMGEGYVLVGTGDEGDAALCEAEGCHKGQVLDGECMRAAFWNRIGRDYSNPASPGDVTAWEIGHVIENWQMEVLGRRVPCMRQVELWLRPPELRYPIHTYLDFVTINPDTGGVLLGESKTSSGRGLKWLNDNGGLRQGWVMQTALGVKAWNATFPHNPVEMIHYLVQARDSGYRYEKERPPTPETIELIFERCVARYAELEVWVARCMAGEDVLPPAEYRHSGSKGEWTHWKCRADKGKTKGYCPYRDMCKECQE